MMKKLIASMCLNALLIANAWGSCSTPSMPNINPQPITGTQITPQDIPVNTQVSIPSVNMPSIGFPSISVTQINPTQINFAVTIVGAEVRPQMLAGLNFSEVYIANPDYRPDAKSVAQTARNEMARFGLEKPVESTLEASLYGKKAPVVADETPATPVNLYSLDNYLAPIQ